MNTLPFGVCAIFIIFVCLQNPKFKLISDASYCLIWRKSQNLTYVYFSGSVNDSIFRTSLETLVYIFCNNVRFCTTRFWGFKDNAFTKTIVSRGDWLGKPANIKVESNGAVVYVGSFLTVHNPLFYDYKLWLNKLMQCFYWRVSSKIERCARQVQKS